MAASLGNAPDLPWPLEAGTPGIEVWYSLVGPRDGAFAFWYRYTLLSTRGGHREARLWAALTDRASPGRSFLVTRRYSLGAAGIDREPFRIAFAQDVELTGASAKGRIDSPLGEVSWDLRYEPDPVVFTPIGSRVLGALATRVAGTSRHRSANEAVRMDGTLRIGDQSLALEAAPGHQGHTSGGKLSRGWSWVQCNAFEDESVVLEALNLGRLTTVSFREGGRTHHLNRVRHLFGRRRNRSRNETGRWHLLAENRDLRLEAEIEADGPTLWQRAAYLSPDDTLRYNAHCSLATVRLRYEVREAGGWTPARALESRAGRAEWVADRSLLPGSHQPTDFEAERSGALHETAP